MTKIFKKVIGIILISAMVMGVSTTAFAEENPSFKKSATVIEKQFIVLESDVVSDFSTYMPREFPYVVNDNNVFCVITSSQLLDLFSSSVNGDPLTIWREIGTALVDVDYSNGFIDISWGETTLPTIYGTTSTYTKTAYRIVGKVGYRSKCTLTTVFYKETQPIYYEVLSNDTSVEKYGNSMGAALSWSSVYDDGPSSNIVTATWDFTVAENNRDYTITNVSD